jgi:hypothetical protein
MLIGKGDIGLREIYKHNYKRVQVTRSSKVVSICATKAMGSRGIAPFILNLGSKCADLLAWCLNRFNPNLDTR